MIDYALDLFPLSAAILAAVTCGLLGNFLVLRQESLMGDAISHAVLPGLIIGLAMTSSAGSGHADRCRRCRFVSGSADRNRQTAWPR